VTNKAEADGYFKVYEEYSKVLRTWFVAYGIGAPALFLTNETAAMTLNASTHAKYIASLFLGGVAIQVMLTSVNKVTMWALYFGEIKPSFKSRCIYRRVIL
jgi:hypothetical protein